MSPSLTILVLTEDTGKGAHDTVVSLLRQTLKLVDPDVQSHRIDWQPNEARLLRAITPSAWRSGANKDRERHVDLIGTIATTLLTSRAPAFVCFHYDGDTRWSRRPGANEHAYDKQIVKRVRALLTSRLPNDPDRVTEALGRLHPMVPYYSIEAWCYQNTRRLLELAVGPEELLAVHAWAADRANLDEIEQPKQHCWPRDRHNADLSAQRWPASEAHAAGTSFAAFVERLRSDEALTGALRSSWDG
jgi:hypothetical protein